MNQEDGDTGNGQPVGPGQRRRQWSGRLLVLLVLIVWLGFFGFAVFDTYVFAVGTPTTAKIEHCTTGFHLSKGPYQTGGALVDYSYRVLNAVIVPSEGCTGTWRIADKTSSGPIIGGDVYRYTGGDPHVRVYGRSAYTTQSLEDSFGVIVLSVLSGAVIVWLVWSLRRFRRRQ
jgi:hypothetical protein